MKPKHLLSITDITQKNILAVLNLAVKLKREYRGARRSKALLAEKTLIMIFEKPSLRTRLSFEIGMTQLGGHAIYLAPSDIGLGVRESVSDVAKVASRMGDIIMARTFKHITVTELARHSHVPVINGLSDLEHPCQILADLLTITEYKGKLAGLKLAFVGDGDNNVTHSLALASGILGIHFSVASPNGYAMLPQITQAAIKLATKTGGSIMQTTDPVHAVMDADIVYTDTWVSMGDEAQKIKRLKAFSPYQVTQKLMSHAKQNVLFMHDLPAYRGNEVATEVIDGQQSIVFDQAENRLHAQKALMVYLLGGV